MGQTFTINSARRLLQKQLKEMGYPPLKQCTLEQLRALRDHFRPISVKTLKIIIKELESRL